MDKQRAVVNVTCAIVFKFLILILGIFLRRFMIVNIGNDANGLVSLFSSIIGILSLTELGIGSAIIYCMYKPIVNNENKKVIALYCAFKKFYKIISISVLGLGLAILPFLSSLAKNYSLENSLYVNYLLMLISVYISYLYSAKTSLINAYKNDYVTTTFYSIGMILELVFQIIVICFFKSLELYFAFKIFNSLFQLYLTNAYCKKHYREIIEGSEKLEFEEKKELFKNAKAMFMHKIGGVLVNSIDSVVISMFVGVAMLGKYTNYTTIVIAMTGIIGLFFAPLASIIGHAFVDKNNENAKRYFDFFFNINFIIGVVFYLGYYAVIESLIPICFGKQEGLILNKGIPFIITINYFVQFMKQTTMLFRDAAGLFYNDRWKPVFEGLTNVALSILFVSIFPEGYEVVGVIVATIITNLLICHAIEPHIVYKHIIKKSPKKHYFKRYFLISVFSALVIVLDTCMVNLGNVYINFLVNGCISIAIALVPCSLMIIIDKSFRKESCHLLNLFFHKFKNKVNKQKIFDTKKDFNK